MHPIQSLLIIWWKIIRSESFLKKELYQAGVSRIEIERAAGRAKVIMYVSKVGIVMGKGGTEIEKTKKKLQKLSKDSLVLDVREVSGLIR